MDLDGVREWKASDQVEVPGAATTEDHDSHRTSPLSGRRLALSKERSSPSQVLREHSPGFPLALAPRGGCFGGSREGFTRTQRCARRREAKTRLRSMSQRAHARRGGAARGSGMAWAPPNGIGAPDVEALPSLSRATRRVRRAQHGEDGTGQHGEHEPTWGDSMRT